MNRSVPDLIEAMRPDRDEPVEATSFLRETARRRRLRRRWRTGLAAGATAVAAMLVLVGLPAALARRSTAPADVGASPDGTTVTTTPAPKPTPQRGRPVLSQTLRATTAGPWAITPYSAQEWVQLAYVGKPGTVKSGGGMVVVYEPGAFDPTEMLRGTTTTVRGHRAYYRFYTDPFSGDEDGNHRNVEPAIAWEYAADAWALVHGTFGEAPPAATDPTVPATLRKVANAVVIGAATPVKVPFKLGHVPAGIHPIGVGISQPGYPGGGIAFDSDADPSDWRDPYAHLIQPFAVAMTAAVPRQFKPDTTLGGLPAMTNGNDIILQRDGYWLTIGAGDRAAPLPKAVIEKVFATMTFAKFADPRTWFAAANSIPPAYR